MFITFVSQRLLRKTKLDVCKTWRLIVGEDVRAGLVLSSLKNKVLAGTLHFPREINVWQNSKKQLVWKMRNTRGQMK